MNSIFTSRVAVLSFAFAMACQAADLKTYSSADYSFQYPTSYSIKEPTLQSKVLIVRGDEGRIEIFKTSDFGTRIHGFSSSGQEEYEAKLVPKEKIKNGNYEIWLFYTITDEKTKKEVQKIAQSMKLK